VATSATCGSFGWDLDSLSRSRLHRPAPERRFCAAQGPFPLVSHLRRRCRTAPKFARLQKTSQPFRKKRIANNYRVLARLAEILATAGWTGIEEIPAAVDLWAMSSDGQGRVLFEVKTLSDANEVHQCRAALSQLLEYKFFHGGLVRSTVRRS
jgi:hypothetical protein